MAAAAPAGSRQKRGKAATSETTAPPAPPADDQNDQTDAPGDAGEEQGGGKPEALAHRNINIPGVTIKLTPVSAIMPKSMSFEKWAETWRQVGNVRESSKWWQGDLLLAGEQRYKEKYAQVLDATSAEYGTLRNITYVAGKFIPERRRVELTWSHHQAAASVPEAVADKILEDAVTKGLSVVDVRMAVKEWKEAQNDAADSGPAPSGGNTNGTGTVSPNRSNAGAAIGLQPVADGEWECPNCPGMMFAEAMWHCLDCGAHVPDEIDGVKVEECPYCDQVAAAGNTDTPPAATGGTTDGSARQPDQIITPDAQNDPSDISELLAFSTMRALDVKDVAPIVRDMGQDGLGALMGLHEWLGRLIEATASKPAREKKAPSRPKYAQGKNGETEGDPVASDTATDATAARSVNSVSKEDQLGGKKSSRKRGGAAVTEPPAPPAESEDEGPGFE